LHDGQDSEIDVFLVVLILCVFVVVPNGCLVGKTLKSQLLLVLFVLCCFSKWLPGRHDSEINGFVGRIGFIGFSKWLPGGQDSEINGCNNM
jgi:hypothetical protein